MTESRPVCVYAMNNLKKNSTRLLIAMCIGIALGAYGIYVQARSHSNKAYVPTISMATHWFADKVGYKLMHPSQMMQSCAGARGAGMMKRAVPHFFMRHLVHPVVAGSGMMNLMINVVQIVLLKVYCKSMAATDVIIGMSAFGWLISMICLFGSFATCKLMCISCFGCQHAAIMYLAYCRRKILQNMLCGSGAVGGSGSSLLRRASACPAMPTNAATTSHAAPQRKKADKYSS